MTTPLDRSLPLQLHPRRRRPAAFMGLGLLVLALVAIARPAATVGLIGFAAGWLLWFAGALMLGLSVLVFSGRLQAIGCAAALMAVGAGAWLTFHPRTGALATALLGAALLMDAAAQLAAALHLRPLPAWRWLLSSSAASLVAAVAMMVIGWAPDDRQTGMLLALAFATSGLALLALAQTPRDTAN